ncbi:MAG: response regulator [Sneathiellaceae bacterium]
MADRLEALVASLPRLRQYMYCITGSREFADDVIRQWLLALSSDEAAPPARASLKDVFAHFHSRSPAGLDRQKLTNGRSPEEEGLHARVLGLPLRERQVLVLVAVIGFDEAAVSEVLDIPQRLVRRLRYRAENRLRRARHTALVMEDEALQGIEIARALGQMGFEVAPLVSNGQEAIASAERFQPDLIIADLSLAGGDDGLEILRRICARQQPAIVYVTAFPDRARSVGDDLSGPVLSKPVTPSKLMTVVHAEMEREA